MRVSVIIVHYGRQHLLDGCLKSLEAQTFRDFEIIVVDNNTVNRGFAAGANAGIRRAKGEYIALLNNDARANQLWLQELVLTAEKNPVGMYASLVLRPNGQVESQGCTGYPDGNGMCRRQEKPTNVYGGGRVYLDGFPSGCAAMYRREMLDQIGLFDESFFMYNEDTDLGIRAKKAGWECVYTPYAVVTHQGSKNTLKKLYYVERNRIKIMLKHFTFWQIVKSPYWTVKRYLKGGKMTQRERYDRGGIGRWYWDYRDRCVMEYLTGGSILDVGCGEMITTRKMGAIGMDLDRGDVCGSVYDIPFPDNTFRTVLLLEVIEHLTRPMAACKEILRVLQPGGKVIVVFPNDRAFMVAWFVCGMWGEIGKDRGHVRQWYPAAAKYLLEATGYRIITQRSIPFHFWPLSLHHIIVGEKC